VSRAVDALRATLAAPHPHAECVWGTLDDLRAVVAECDAVDAALAHAEELTRALRAWQDAAADATTLRVRAEAERNALRAAALALLGALAAERRAWSAPLSGLPLPRYGGGPAETAAREVAEAALRALAAEVTP
jgi:hypothetical protein